MNGRYFRGNGSTAITFLTNSEIETTNPEISTARLGKPERIFYAPLFLSGVPKLIRQTQTVQIGALILCTAFLDIGGNCAERIAKIPTSQNPKMSLLHASISPENFLR